MEGGRVAVKLWRLVMTLRCVCVCVCVCVCSTYS